MHKRSILSISDWTFPVLVTCSSDVDTVSGVCALRGSVSTVPPWVWDGDCILPTPKCFQPRFRTKTSTTHPPWKYSSSREVCIWNRWFIRRPSVPCRKGVDFSAFWKTSRFTRDEVGCASWNNCDRCEIRVCFFPSFFFFSFFFFFFYSEERSWAFVDLHRGWVQIVYWGTGTKFWWNLLDSLFTFRLFKKLENGIWYWNFLKNFPAWSC